MPSVPPGITSLVRIERSPLTKLVARVLVLTLLSWSLPFDDALPRRAAASVAGAAAVAGTLYVNANAAAACGGKSPCFTSIQRAIDAVGPGERIEIQAGEYFEQLRIQRKNAAASASETDRIVIEADPETPPGSVLLRGHAARCEGGYAIELSRSKFVTIRGLSIVGAGVRGIGLRGGSLENTGIHLERNRIAGGGPRECNGGIDIGRGNPQTVIANNLIHGNGRNGIRFRDGRGGSYYVVGNTIARNAWSGIQISHAARVELVNNLIVANGWSPGSRQTRVGVRRLRTNPSPAEHVRLLGNLVCGNVGGELVGPLLDATDAANSTPGGGEGPGVAPSATCGDLATLFRDADGADDLVDTADDDFHLLAGSPAVDAGVDPRLLGHPAASAVYEADFDRAGARPRDGDADQVTRFDAGAHETSDDSEPTPTPSAPPTSTPTPDPATPTPTPSPTATPRPTPTPEPTAEPTATPAPTADPTPTPEPIPCLACDACDSGQAGICSAGRTFCDGPFAEPECRTTIEPRTEACGNAIDEDCDGEVDEGGVPEQLPTTPPQTGAFVEPLGTTIKFPNGGSAKGLAQGDFNQDGLVDLAVAEDANGHNGRRISIILGNGDATFGEPTHHVISQDAGFVNVHAVLAHDFDRDGPLDLLVPFAERHQVNFYRGDGNGNFAEPVPSSMGGPAGQIQTADLNCDGILDFAAIVDATHVTVGFGNGDGTFAPTTSFLFNHNLVDLALTDVNGDGHPDLVTGSHEFAPTTGIGVRLNDGAGQFGDLKHTPGQSVPDQFGNHGHNQVNGIQIADFDGDTRPDAVASTHGPGGCFMFMKGNGDGTFALPDLFNGAPHLDPSWTCVGGGFLMRRYTDNVAPDVNADGKPDVLFTFDENRVVIGISRGDGTFDASVFASSADTGFPGSGNYQRADGSGTLAALVADVNGDCMLDVVTNGRQTNAAHGRQGVLLARAPGDFHAPRISPLLRDPTGDNGNQMERGVTVGDFDKDGNPDFAAGVGRAFFTVPGAGIGIDIWKGNGDGRGEALPFTLNNFPGTGGAYLRTADFDQDGFLDFLFQGGDGPSGSRHSVSTVFGQGDFTFVDRQAAYSPRLDANEVHIRNIITTDLDGDEDPDVVALYDNGGFTKWFATFSNPGTRAPLQFVAEVEVGQGSNGRGIVAADFDGDDIPDLVAQDSGFANPQRVRLFKGNGDLTFDPGVSIFEWTAQGAASAEDFAAADLDEDGDQDLVMAQFFHPCAYVFLGHDDGTFDAPVCYPFWTSRTSRLAIDDFDVDGSLDIVAGVEDGGLMFLRGRGDGTFETTQMYAVGRGATQMVNVADFDRDGRPDLLWSYNDAQFGHSIVLSNPTGGVPTPTPAPTATLPPGVTHTPQPTPTPTPTPRPTGTPPEGLASLVVEPVDPIILAGETQQFTATGVLDDGTSVDLTAAVAWSSGTPAAASMNATGLATGVAGGTSMIIAAIGPFSDSSTLTVGARVAGDTVDPVAEITSPAANAEVTQPVDVIGTATDANFLEYELAIAPAGATSFTRIGGGAAPVANGVLGQLDPTLLINDQYVLRLTVFDRGGNATTASIVVQIAEDMKIGNFSVTFTDLAIPLAGIPLAIDRVYDSRDKRSGDFGFGWRLELQQLRVRANRVLGTGWTTQQSGFNVQLVPLDVHKVSVTLPSGKVEEFDLQLSPTQAPFSLDATQVVGFQPRPGTLGRLEALADGDLLVIPAGAEVELTDFGINTYDPVRYRYTAPNGTAFVVHRTNGVESITDANGNVLTVGPGGITHSSGRGVTFTRDGSARITAITDPLGKVRTYTYDANGDLTSYTDPASNVVRYKYDRRHGLLHVIDPLGRPGTRNEYDDGGRLVAVTGPEGNRIELAHSIGARQEVTRDAEGNPTVTEYDAAGRILEVTDALGGVTTRTYDAAGNETSTTNAVGDTVARTFDARGNKLTETIAGETTTYTYGAGDRVASITDPNGHVRTFAYDTRGNLLSVTNALGLERAYTYDAAGNPKTETNAEGDTATFEYDAFGNRTARIDAHGEREEFEFDANGRLTVHRDRAGNEALTTYDDRGLVIGTTDRLGRATSIQRDALGPVRVVTDAAGNTTSREYDAAGRPLHVDDALGKRTTYAYSVRGDVTGVLDRGGHATTISYDALQRRSRVTAPNGSTSEYSYDAASRIVGQTDANGHEITFGRDAAGRVTAITDALSRSILLEYDAAGNLIKETDRAGNETTYQYDALDRPIRANFADGGFEEREYDRVGRVTRRVDRAGDPTSFEYDANGNLAKVIDALGGETTYGYDANGRLASHTDALGRVTTFSYDAVGRRIAKTYPSGTQELREYDVVGNLIRTTSPSGIEIEFEYDAQRQLTAKTYPDVRRVEFTYGATGTILSATDEHGSTTFAYDALDRLTAITRPDGSSLAYGYDAKGNRTSVAAKIGAAAVARTTTYVYDAVDRLAAVEDPDGATTSYDYDDIDSLTRIEHANGTTTALTYDQIARLNAVELRRGAQVLERFTYDLDDVGNRTLLTELDGSTKAFSYDALRRLEHERHEDASGVATFDRQYTHDAVGNRLEAIDLGGVTTTYSYDALDRLLSAGSTSYGYDVDGRMTSRSGPGGSVTYDYDFESRLTGVSKTTGAVSFEYDAVGSLVRTEDSGGARNLLVDPSSIGGISQVLAEYDDGGGALAEYVFGHGPISQQRGALESYFHADASLNVRALTDGAGSLTDRYDYEAFGNPVSASGATENVHRFAGERFDPTSELYHLRARFYDPGSGRFTTRDPFEGSTRDPMSRHRYTYAHQNPVSFMDPTGELTVPTLSQVLIGIGIIGTVLFLATNPVALTKGVVFNAVRLTHVDPLTADALRGNEQAAREADEILRLFNRWYAENEPKLQSFALLGYAGRPFGRTQACGDHAVNLGRYILQNTEVAFQKFKFRVFNEGLVTHTFLIAEWREGDVAINLDSWLFGLDAPRVPIASTLGDEDVTESFLSEQQQRLVSRFHEETICRISP